MTYLLSPVSLSWTYNRSAKSLGEES